jgi:hypothetical protein
LPQIAAQACEHRFEDVIGVMASANADRFDDAIAPPHQPIRARDTELGPGLLVADRAHRAPKQRAHIRTGQHVFDHGTIVLGPHGFAKMDSEQLVAGFAGSTLNQAHQAVQRQFVVLILCESNGDSLSTENAFDHRNSSRRFEHARERTQSPGNGESGHAESTSALS